VTRYDLAYRKRSLCSAGRAILPVLLAVLASAQAVPLDPSAVEREKLVREFVAAFNAQDSRRMLALADEKIEWISLTGAALKVDAAGATALQRSMDAYFKQCPSCRSTLEWVQSSTQRVVTLERAEWIRQGERKSQTGLAVYEFRQRKISRVYYFPAE